MDARKATKSRKTNETDIRVALNLDGTGEYQIGTGIPFFDHMLAQLARHGHFDLKISAKGDLEIDGHHTVEDVWDRRFARAVATVAALSVSGTRTCR